MSNIISIKELSHIRPYLKNTMVYTQDISGVSHRAFLGSDNNIMDYFIMS